MQLKPKTCSKPQHLNIFFVLRLADYVKQSKVRADVI